MGQKWLILLLLVDVNARYCDCTATNDRNAVSRISSATNAFRKESTGNATFYLINPKQIDSAERAIGKFLLKLTGPSTSNDRASRSRLSYSSGEQLIRQISAAIRERLMELAREYGLEETRKRYEKTVSRSAQVSTGHWYPEAIFQGTLLISDILRMIDEGLTSVNRYARRNNISVHDPFKRMEPSRDLNEIHLFDSINSFIDIVSQLSQCVPEAATKPSRESHVPALKRRNFIPEQPTKTLRPEKPEVSLQDSPEVSLRDSPEVPLQDSPEVSLQDSPDVSLRGSPEISPRASPGSGLPTLLCRLATRRDESGRSNCLDAFQRAVECLEDAPPTVPRTTPSVATSWLTATSDLSDCRARRDSTLVCPASIATRRSDVRRRLRFVYDQLGGSGETWTRTAANELADALARSRTGRRVARDLYLLSRVYRDGRARVERLAKIAARRRRYYPKYRKVLKSLNDYKRGFLLNTILSIRRGHDAMHAFQRHLMSIDPGHSDSWGSYMGLLRSITDWMNVLLAFTNISYSDPNDVNAFTTNTSSRSSAKTDKWREKNLENIFHADGSISNPKRPNSGSNIFADSYRRKDLRKSTDLAFARVLRRMNEAGDSRATRTRSALTTIVNNVLLAAMFVETVGLVTSLFSYQSLAAESENSAVSGPAGVVADNGEEDVNIEDYDS